MDILEFRKFCLENLPHSEESTPFDESTLVFKVGGKMYALCNMDNFTGISMKCAPERALELREAYPEITAAFHMNKTHWNTVGVCGDLHDSFIRELVRQSYDLVVMSLTKAVREALFK